MGRPNWMMLSLGPRSVEGKGTIQKSIKLQKKLGEGGRPIVVSWGTSPRTDGNLNDTIQKSIKLQKKLGEGGRPIVVSWGTSPRTDGNLNDKLTLIPGGLYSSMSRATGQGGAKAVGSNNNNSKYTLMLMMTIISPVHPGQQDQGRSLQSAPA